MKKIKFQFGRIYNPRSFGFSIEFHSGPYHKWIEMHLELIFWKLLIVKDRALHKKYRKSKKESKNEYQTK